MVILYSNNCSEPEPLKRKKVEMSMKDKPRGTTGIAINDRITWWKDSVAPEKNSKGKKAKKKKKPKKIRGNFVFQYILFQYILPDKRNIFYKQMNCRKYL